MLETQNTQLNFSYMFILGCRISFSFFFGCFFFRLPSGVWVWVWLWGAVPKTLMVKPLFLGEALWYCFRLQ